MAKLTKAQRSRIEYILQNVQRAQRYLYSPTVAIAHKRAYGTTTLDYIRPDGTALYEVAKEYGSDLCGLDLAITNLKLLLTGPVQEKE